MPADGWQNAGLAWGPRYKVAWRVLDAQYFGVPQRRRRVFIVGYIGDGRAAEVLFERESGDGNIAQSGEARQGTSETFTINLANSGANQNNVKKSHVSDTLDTWGTQGVAFNYKNSASRSMGVYPVVPTLEAQHVPSCVMAHGQANAEIVSDGEPSLTLNHEAPILFDARNGTITGNISMTLQSGMQKSLNAAPLVWHNHQQDGSIRVQGETLPTVSRQWGMGGNNVPFVGVRRLTPTECERLQGFPDGWTDGQADTVRYRQLGNAVAVPVVEWIAKRLVKAMEA